MVPHALLAFGRRVSASDAFEELVASRGWQMESWRPTFVDANERDHLLSRDPAAPDSDWNARQVLRRPATAREPAPESATDSEGRLMVASAGDLPTLYYVEWHYIDFVLSCIGNVSEAARVLDIRRSTLQRKRKKLPPTR
jgi:hypothetical protein